MLLLSKKGNGFPLVMVPCASWGAHSGDSCMVVLKSVAVEARKSTLITVLHAEAGLSQPQTAMVASLQAGGTCVRLQSSSGSSPCPSFSQGSEEPSLQTDSLISAGRNVVCLSLSLNACTYFSSLPFFLLSILRFAASG